MWPKRTSIGATVRAVITASTPGTASASPESIETMFACARSERTATPCAAPGSARSSAYFARPVTFATPSTRGTEVPEILGSATGHGLGRVEHSVDDRLVAGAAADAAFEPVHDLLARRCRVRLEERLRRHHHPRRAEPALEGRVLQECLLHRVQVLLGDAEALDRLDRPPVELERERRAGADGQAVELHGAGAADLHLAARLRAGQTEVAQEVEQEQRIVDLERLLAAVDRPADARGRSGAHRASSSSARRTMTPVR